MIQLKNISKSFNDQKVIKGIDLDIQEGSTHVLLGPSGCGKTTLLRMICGLTKPDNGDVVLNGNNINGLSTQDISNHLGYVIQDGGLFPHLSARENIMLPVKIRNLEETPFKKRISEMLEMVELEDFLLDKLPKQLSGGQRQRVALLRGLILDPKIVLLDEPLSALDPLVRMNLQIQLKNIFKKLNKTVVLVTHDLHEASYLGDVISLLEKGDIAQQGNFQNLLKTPNSEFVREFITAQIPEELT